MAFLAERLAYLEAVIGADVTQFRKAMRDVRNDVGILSETIGGLGKLGRTMTFAISAPLATLGSFAVQSASEFDGAMRNINSIVGLTEEQFKDLSASVVDFGKTTRGGVVESANSLYTVFSAGITDTAQAMDIMSVATMTAEAGLADMEVTTESLVASVLGFGSANMTATRASDALTQMVQIGVGSMQSFASATAKVTPSASALGIEIEELYASLAFLTQRGVKVAEASTQIRSAFTALQKPTEDMEKAFVTLGVNGAEDLIDKFGGMEGAFKALINTTDGTTGAIAKLFANTRAKDFVLQVANNMDIYGQAMDDFEAGVEGATSRAHVEQMKSFGAQWDLMTSALESTAIVIGQVLLPVITPLVHGLTDFMLGVSELNPELLQMGVAFAGILTIVPPLIWLFATLLNPIGLLVAGVTALGAVFINNLGGISNAISDLASSIPALGSLINTFENLFGVAPTAEDVVAGLGVTIKPEELIQIEAESGKFVWDYWLERTDQSITWEEFKTAWIANNGTLDIIAGELVTINETEIGGEIGSSFNATDAIFQAEIDRLNKLEIEADRLIAINSPEGIALGFGMKMQIGFNALKDKIPTILGTVLESMRVWFDTNVGAGIGFIASLFDTTGSTGAGDSPIYTAIQKVFSGDLEGALNAIVPELGTKIANFFSSIFDTGADGGLPKIQTALGTLFVNIGSWLEMEAIPTLSRSIGFIAGKLAVLLFDGMKMVGEFFSGGGAGDAIGGIGEFVDTAIASPLSEGFDDAVAGTDMANAFTGIVTGIETAIDDATLSATTGFTTFADGVSTAITDARATLKTVITTLTEVFDVLEFDQLVVGIGDLATGLVDFATDIAGADFSGIVKLMGGLVAIANVVGGAVLTLAGEMLGTFGDAVADFLNGISSLMSGDSDGFSQIIAGFIDLAFALLTFPITVIDDLMTALGDLVGLDLSGFKETMQGIKDGIDELVYVDPQVEVGSFEWSLGAGFDETTNEVLAGMDEAVLQALSDFQVSNDLDLSRMQLAIKGIDWVLAGEDPQSAIEQIWEQYNWAFTDEQLIELMDIGFIITDGAPVVTGVDDAVTSATDGLTTGAEEDTTPVAPVIFDEEAIKTASTAVGVSASEALGSSMKDEFLNGDMTPETFQAEFLTPFNDNWVATFGSGSAIQTSITDFSTQFGTGSASVVASALVMGAGTIQATSMMANGVDSQLGRVNDAFKEAKGNVEAFYKQIRLLATLATNLQVKVTVEGSIASAGIDASASGGLGRVPRDGFVVETHKDEMILPAHIANSVREGASASASNNNGSNISTSSSNTTNNIVIDASTVDDILNEFGRRGIDIGQ